MHNIMLGAISGAVACYVFRCVVSQLPLYTLHDSGSMNPSPCDAPVRPAVVYYATNISKDIRLTTRRATAMVQMTEHCYIITDDRILSGEPIIKGTRTPVRAIVELWRLGITPEEMPQRLPHLTLAQVFAALSYYSDHQTEIHAHIERNRIPDALIDPLVKDL